MAIPPVGQEAMEGDLEMDDLVEDDDEDEDDNEL